MNTAMDEFQEDAAMIAEGQKYDDPPEEHQDAMVVDDPAFPSQLGGGAKGMSGHFVFDPQNYVDRSSDKMGVRERHYDMRVEQVGTFQYHQNLSSELTSGLHHALLKLIDTNDLPPRDKLYINLSSRRLNRAFNYHGLQVQEWKEGSVVSMPYSSI